MMRRLALLLTLLLLSTFYSTFAESATMNNNNDDECPADGSKECITGRFQHAREFYINGTWVKPAAAAAGDDDMITVLDVIDPSTGEPIASISLGTQYDTDAAVAAAKAAFPSWSQLSIDQRRYFVERLLEIYTERKEEMAQAISMEMGAPIDMARDAQVSAGSYHIRSFLDALRHFEVERTLPGIEKKDASTTIFMEPIGIVAMITPWNWPMNQVCLKVIPALLVGCTCILKPSEVAPLSSLLFTEMMHEAGFPPGVFNLVNGNGEGVGTQLSVHPDVRMVSFTGSTRAGSLISKNAASTFKRVSLELGGKGANLIFADVGEDDFTSIIQNGVWDCFGNSGQSCNAPTRMLVERSMYDQAVEIAINVVKEEEVKSAHVTGDHLGPVVSQAQYDKIQRYIQIGIDEGARLVAGGLGRPDGTNPRGFYVKPTVFVDVNNNMTIMQEEIFGPVLCIMPFDTEEEAVAIANDSPYGLTNYVHSYNSARLRRLARALQSGMVEMNGMGGDDGSPFGGVKASGSGREGGVYGLEEFCEIKAVTGLEDDE